MSAVVENVMREPKTEMELIHDGDGERAGEPILSLADSAARSIPLRAWSDSARRQIVNAVAAALKAWRTAWGPTASSELHSTSSNGDLCGVQFDAEALAITRGVEVWRCLPGAGAGMWWAASASGSARAQSLPHEAESVALAAIYRVLFGEPLPRPSATASGGRPAHGAATIALEVAQAAWDDLCGRVASLFGHGGETPDGDVNAPPRQVASPWSGAMALTLSEWGIPLVVLVAGDRVASLLTDSPAEAAGRGVTPRGERLVPVMRALTQHGARLDVQLRPFELGLGALTALRVGDVLRTTHTLDAPVVVTIEGSGEVLCEAFMGRSAERRAVELMRHQDGVSRDASGERPARAVTPGARPPSRPL